MKSDISLKVKYLCQVSHMACLLVVSFGVGHQFLSTVQFVLSCGFTFICFKHVIVMKVLSSNFFLSHY